MAGICSNGLRSRTRPSTFATAPNERAAVGKEEMRVLTFLVLAAITLGTSSRPIGAEEIALKRWWIHTGGFTHHISNDKDRNGENYGLGLEYKFSETQSLRAGVFNNSFERRAPYLSYVWLPWHWGSFRVGGNAVVAGGYPNRTGALASVIPWGEVTWKYVGFELGVLPIKKGIVTAQFKFRFD